MRKRWRWRQPREQVDPTLARDLARALGVPELIGQLLVLRGVRTAEQARRMLYPKLTDLYDPVLIPGLEEAVDRLLAAVAAQRPIVIYGDYDVDGVAGTAILWHMLKAAGGRIFTYIPHRIEEGYGLNVEAIRRIAYGRLSNGYNGQPVEQAFLPEEKPLVVSVDCGISAFEPARAARELGLELIVTDHHEPGRQLPEAQVLVHPRLPGSRYPFGELCGAGVAFKMAWHMARRYSRSERVPEDLRGLLLDLVSLAALGTVADVAPLVDENRIITVYGLGQIKRTRFAGLNALIDAARLRDERIDAYHVGFILGPRLNACGRMGHAREALRLLTEAQGQEARALAELLGRQNEDRRATEQAILQEAREMVRAYGYDRPECRAIVLGKEGWHVGVVGIVASQLVEEFHRPVVLLGIDPDGQAHGSARSVDGLSIHEAFCACAEYLTSFGGHRMAAGLRLPAERIEIFRQALVEFVNARLRPEDLRGLVEIDLECSLEQMTSEVFRAIQRLGPFGAGHPAPCLCLREVELARDAQRVGASGQHLRLWLRQGRYGACAVWFDAGELAEHLPAGTRVDVLFEPVLSTWQGLERGEYHIVDLRLRD